MFRLLLLAAAAAIALTASVTAAMALFRSPDITVDWGAHKSLAALKCEDAKTIADVAATINDMMWPNKVRAFSPTAKVKIFHSRTVFAHADRIDCRIMPSVSGYSPNSLSGTFTAELHGSGKWVVYFTDID